MLSSVEILVMNQDKCVQEKDSLDCLVLKGNGQT